MRVGQTVKIFCCAAILLAGAYSTRGDANAAAVIEVQIPGPGQVLEARQECGVGLQASLEQIVQNAVEVAAQQGPPTICVDTVQCGGCCATVGFVHAWLACVKRGEDCAECFARWSCR